MFFESIAYAQDAAPQGQGSMFASFMPLILIMVVFYFLLIRPQQKKAKEHKAMLADLKRGDKILTGGGLYGRIQSVKDDVLTVELADGVTVQVNRNYVSGIGDPKAPKPE